MARSSNVSVADMGSSALGRIDAAAAKGDIEELKAVYADLIATMRQASQDG